jgi:spermidine/putrescine transport system permease protein
MVKEKKSLKIIAISLCLLFLYLPLGVMAFFSFNEAKSLSHFTGFSLRWYESLFGNSQLLDAVFVSVSVAIIATVVSTILGTITAIALSKSKKVVKTAVLQVNNLPIMNPEIVTAISLMLLFSFLNIEKGYLTMLLAHIAFCTPYVITNVLPKVNQLDPNLADAAMDLGASPLQTLIKVILPQIKPGIVAGALLAFTMSFDDFIISYFVTGNGVENISILIYSMSKRVNPSIYALSTIVIFVIFVILIIGTFIPYLLVKKRGNQVIQKVKKQSRFPYQKTALAVLAMIVVVAAVWSWKPRRQLKVYNAGEYIDETVLKDFEKEYDCEVIYEIFDSNETMYTKLLSGENYDVIVPSDYMIERLIDEELIQKIDKSKITNRSHLEQSILHQPFDKNDDYWVPYFYGTVGILYDKTKVDKKDFKDGWNILLNQKYKGNIYMYDSVRDSFMIALKALGYSMNTINEKEVIDAKNWLVKQRQTMNPIYATDEVIDNMKNGEKAMAITYSGDAAAVMDENENMSFFMPEEGTNRWYDGFVICKDSQQTDLANQFINFMIRDDISYRNTVEVGYLTSNAQAAKKASQEVFKGNTAYNIHRHNKNDEVFAYQKQSVKEMYDNYYTKEVINSQ